MKMTQEQKQQASISFQNAQEHIKAMREIIIFKASKGLATDKDFDRLAYWEVVKSNCYK